VEASRQIEDFLGEKCSPARRYREEGFFFSIMPHRQSSVVVRDCMQFASDSNQTTIFSEPTP
jgi:hypothetical protein